MAAHNKRKRSAAVNPPEARAGEGSEDDDAFCDEDESKDLRACSKELLEVVLDLLPLLVQDNIWHDPDQHLVTCRGIQQQFVRARKLLIELCSMMEALHNRALAWPGSSSQGAAAEARLAAPAWPRNSGQGAAAAADMAAPAWAGSSSQGAAAEARLAAPTLPRNSSQGAAAAAGMAAPAWAGSSSQGAAAEARLAAPARPRNSSQGAAAAAGMAAPAWAGSSSQDAVAAAGLATPAWPRNSGQGAAAAAGLACPAPSTLCLQFTPGRGPPPYTSESLSKIATLSEVLHVYEHGRHAPPMQFLEKDADSRKWRGRHHPDKDIKCRVCEHKQLVNLIKWYVATQCPHVDDKQEKLQHLDKLAAKESGSTVASGYLKWMRKLKAQQQPQQPLLAKQQPLLAKQQPLLAKQQPLPTTAAAPPSEILERGLPGNSSTILTAAAAALAVARAKGLQVPSHLAPLATSLLAAAGRQVQPMRSIGGVSSAAGTEDGAGQAMQAGNLRGQPLPTTVDDVVSAFLGQQARRAQQSTGLLSGCSIFAAWRGTGSAWSAHPQCHAMFQEAAKRINEEQGRVRLATRKKKAGEGGSHGVSAAGRGTGKQLVVLLMHLSHGCIDGMDVVQVQMWYRYSGPPEAPTAPTQQPAASEPGPSTPPPAKRSKRTKAEQAAEPTKGKGKGKGKAAKAKLAPQPDRWLDRDCNATLNMQHIRESRWRPLELCCWPDQGALPSKGIEYPSLGYKRLRDKPPQAQQQQQAVEAQCQWQEAAFLGHPAAGALSQRHGKYVRGLVWCHEVTPNPTPPAQDPPAQAPSPPAQEPPPPPSLDQPPAQPPPGPVPPPKGPPWGRWLDLDTNGCLSFQRIGESMHRPLKLCSWDDREALPPIGEGYQQGYKLVNDRLPEGRKRLSTGGALMAGPTTMHRP
ncbi:hypothetical protein QJQ45_004153 [Haematococcus lacustris]|nr:hypothetical protein QJQ45_004153 [Haematococcus lacustris]